MQQFSILVGELDLATTPNEKKEFLSKIQDIYSHKD